MNKTLIMVTFVGLTFTGCSNPLRMFMPTKHTISQKHTPIKHPYQKPTAEKLDAYNEKMSKVASGIKDDPKYNRIALDTPEKKAWFQDLTYRLWDRQITRQEFLTKGLQRYPTHRYEFAFVIKGFAS